MSPYDAMLNRELERSYERPNGTLHKCNECGAVEPICCGQPCDNCGESDWSPFEPDDDFDTDGAVDGPFCGFSDR